MASESHPRQAPRAAALQAAALQAVLQAFASRIQLAQPLAPPQPKNEPPQLAVFSVLLAMLTPAKVRSEVLRQCHQVAPRCCYRQHHTCDRVPRFIWHSTGAPQDRHYFLLAPISAY